MTPTLMLYADVVGVFRLYGHDYDTMKRVNETSVDNRGEYYSVSPQRISSRSMQYYDANVAVNRYITSKHVL